MTVDMLLTSQIITPLLKYHMIPGAVSVADLQNGQTLETMLDDLTVNVTLPPTALPRTLGIEDFNFVTIHGAANNALIVTQDLQAGQVSSSMCTRGARNWTILHLMGASAASCMCSDHTKQEG